MSASTKPGTKSQELGPTEQKLFQQLLVRWIGLDLHVLRTFSNLRERVFRESDGVAVTAVAS